jgi:hypothetical protein
MTLVWRRLLPQEIDHEQLWLAVASAGLVALALTTVHIVDIQLPTCVFKGLTGLPCPTCGVTRAVMALTRLDLARAVAMNPLAVAGAALGALYLAYAATVLAGGLPRFRPTLTARDWSAIRALTAAAVSINWIYLVLAGR